MLLKHPNRKSCAGKQERANETVVPRANHNDIRAIHAREGTAFVWYGVRMRAWARRLVLAALGLATQEVTVRMHLKAGAVGLARGPGVNVALMLAICGFGAALSDVATKLQRAEVAPSRGGSHASLGVLTAVAMSYAIRGLSVTFPFDQGYAATVTLTSLAVVAWASFERTRAGLIIGIVAGAVGVLTEAVLVGQGVYQYSEALRHIGDVPAWLFAVYFPVGVAVSQVTRAINAALRIDR